MIIASLAEFACKVPIPASPELRAINRSNASASRTSPITMREGRMRSASLISFLSGIAPSPWRFSLRVCIATKSGNTGFNSKTSSIVITRCPKGVADTSALSIVVFPDWVPPLTKMFNPARTELVNATAIEAVKAPR